MEGFDRFGELDGRNLTGQVPILPRDNRCGQRDLSKKITVDVKGRFWAPKTRLTRWWTSAVIRVGSDARVAREVGTEGKLGGQADVKGVAAHGRI